MSTRLDAGLDRLALASMLLYAVLMLLWIGTGPKVWVDEPWVSIPAVQLVESGQLNNPVMTGMANREEHILSPSTTYILSLAASFKVFGVGVFQGRLVSALAIFAAMVFGYLLARRLFGPGTALLATLMLMVNNIVFVSAATIRAEAMVAAMTLAAVYAFFLGADTGRARHFAIAGLVAGVALHVHPNAFLGLVAIGVLFLMRFGIGVVLRAPFWTFAGGVALGVLPYAAYVIVADGDNGFRDFLAQIGGRARPMTEDSFLVHSLKEETKRYAQYIFFPKRALIAVIEAAGLVWALVARNRAQRLLAVVVLVHLLLFPLLIVNRTARYFTVLMPFVSILTAKGLADLAGAPGSLGELWRRIRGGRLTAIAALLLGLIYLGNQFAGDAWLVWKNRHNDYEGFVERLAATIPEGARVWGSVTYWFGFTDHPYRTQYTYGEDLDTFRPEYVILYDDDVWGGKAGVTGRRTGSALHEETRRRVEALVAERGTFVAKVADLVYGEVEVDRIDW